MVVPVVLAGLQFAVYYGQLPDTVASHFGARGVPNGWMSKRGFFWFEAGLLAVLLLSFAGSTWLCRKLPSKWVNLPHKDYWLAPERKEQTLAVLSDFMLRMGAATMLFMVCIQQLVIDANLRETVQLSEKVWVLLGIFVIYLVVWLARFYTHFRRPAPSILH